MSAMDTAAGYPVHAVAQSRRWTNPHGVNFTDWTAACGAEGFETSHQLSTAHSARKAELCKACWPQGHQTPHPTPREVSV